MKLKKTLLCLGFSSTLLAMPVLGQLVPEGDEFVVNTYTTGRQFQPWVASGPGGDFVVVWDDSYSRVSGRRFAADGTPFADEFQINSSTTGRHGVSTLDIGPTGEFTVIWQTGTSFDVGLDGDKAGIMGQQFNAGGSPVGGEFQVNSNTTESQRNPSMAIGPTGEFVVVWDSKHDGAAYNIQAQLFSAAGAPIGNEFQVNSGTHGTGVLPSLGVAPGGDFIVVWQGFGSVGNDDGWSIQGQRFDDDGNRLGPQFQVNDYTTGNQFSPRLAIDSDGNFVVVWNSFGSPGNDFSQDSVQARRFAANATPLGGQFQVNTYTTQIQRKASVTIDPSGGFTVSWTSGFPNPGIDGPDGSLFGIAARPYRSDGSPASGEFVVNTFTLYSQYRNSVTSGPDGQIVVVWESIETGPAPDFGPSVLGQRFKNSAFVFTDGFESGNISNWSSSTP